MRVPRGLLSIALAVGATACVAASEPRGAADAENGVGRDAAPAPAEGWYQSGCALPIEYLQRLRRGYYPGRSPDVVIVPREPNLVGTFIGQSHSGPWDYVQKVPLVLYGPGFIRARGRIALDREVTLADLAPTLAELLGGPARKGPGKPLREVLVPEERRPGRPRLVATVVWDGGGTNVLETWPQAWPELARLMREGSAVADVTVGSSPSITPAAHTTIGTGAWPRRTGITSILLRTDGRMMSPFPDMSPSLLEVHTLADDYDLATGNRAKVGMVGFKSWHLGMIGHGAYLPGADRDIAIMRNGNRPVTNPLWYRMPSWTNDLGGLEQAIRRVDIDDGRIDGKWMGHDVLEGPTAAHLSPASILYQTRLIEALLTRARFGRDETPDLFYTNYKQPDKVGHEWNMLYPEMRATLRYVDGALGDLTAFLDATVGRRRWVMVVTADHGQGPLPAAVGAWPIDMSVLVDDMATRFDIPANAFVESTSAHGLWFDRAVLAANDVSLGEISDWLVSYRLEDNLDRRESPRPQYEARVREPLFQAAFPNTAQSRIWACARRD